MSINNNGKRREIELLLDSCRKQLDEIAEEHAPGATPIGPVAALPIAALKVVPQDGTGRPDIIPRSELAPEFLRGGSQLLENLFHGAEGPQLASVLFCGVDRDVNSSAICCGVAEMLAAQQRKSICVVDADFRSPGIHRELGIDNVRGFSEALLQPGPIRGFARRYAADNLFVITAGEASAAELLSNSEQLRARMLELKAEFDFLLLNAAPAGLHLDAVILGQHLDGAVLVLESNTTRREVAFQAKQALDAAKIRILGAVLQGHRVSKKAL